jgi:hypothetical protein
MDAVRRFFAGAEESKIECRESRRADEKPWIGL